MGKSTERPSAISGASSSAAAISRFHIIQRTHLRAPHYSHSEYEPQSDCSLPTIEWEKAYCVSLNYTKHTIGSTWASKGENCVRFYRGECARARFICLFVVVYAFLFCLLSFWFTLCNNVHVQNQIPPERIVPPLCASGVVRCRYKQQSILI